MPWSSDAVRARTVEACEQSGLCVSVGQAFLDVDTEDDWRRVAPILWPDHLPLT